MELVVSIIDSAVIDLSHPHRKLWAALQSEFMHERPTFPEHISSRCLNKIRAVPKEEVAVGLIINKEGLVGRRTIIDTGETSTMGMNVVFRERLREVKEVMLDFKFTMLASLPTRPPTESQMLQDSEHLTVVEIGIIRKDVFRAPSE